MPPEYKSSPRAHAVRIVLTLIGMLVVGSVARQALLPAGFGEHGYYRPGAVLEEAHREVRNQSNESCYSCHPFIRKIAERGIHKEVSCEFCHGAYADHVRENLVIGIMPVSRGQDLQQQCLRCHRQMMRALHPDSMKVVALPAHLEQKKVRTDHLCNQCHHVHAPMKWVNEAREMVGLDRDRRGS